MEKYPVEKLKRNNTAIKNSLKVVKDKTLTTRNLHMLVPEFYVDKELMNFEDGVNCICIFILVDDNYNYGLFIAPVFQRFTPYLTSKVNIDGEVYYRLDFGKDSILLDSNTTVQSKMFLFNLFETFFLLGKIPFFIDYIGLSNLLSETEKYCGSNIGSDIVAMDLITATITRVKNNETVYYKHVVNKPEDLNKFSPSFKGLKDINFSLDNTGARLVGGYLEQNMINAVIDQNNKNITPIENIIKG